jgi:putative membrane protein
MFYTVLTGFLMALADSVPGVSGGTIVFLMGLYDRFITSLSDLIHGTREARRKAMPFLIPLGLGWLVGMGMAVSVLAEVFTNSIYAVSSLFYGLVLASIPLIAREEKEALSQMKYLPFAFLGAGIVIGLSFLNLSSLMSSGSFSFLLFLYVLAAGFCGICAMVLPGISGSSLLMAFGLYVPFITGLRNLMIGDFTDFWILLALLIGALLAVRFAFSGIKNLLKTHRSPMIYGILGMMAGSLYAIRQGPTTLTPALPAMALSDIQLPLFLIGIALVLGLALLKKKAEKKLSYAH